MLFRSKLYDACTQLRRQDGQQHNTVAFIQLEKAQRKRLSTPAHLPAARVFASPQRSPSPTLPPDATPAAKALAQGTLGIGFSAGGLLYPYYVGIMSTLQSQGVLTAQTPVAGASAGSLVAMSAKSGLSEEELMAGALEVAAQCRVRGTRGNLGPVLADVLDNMLPDDIHERVSAGRVHVAVTRCLPTIKPQLVSRFDSRQDLIDALLTSCHIPWYFDGRATTRFRGEVHCDGGLTNFIPMPPGVEHGVKVCCFPSQQMRGAFGSLCITPDTFEPDWPHDMRTMLGWALNPASDEQLLALLDKGKRDAHAWIAAHKLDTAWQLQSMDGSDTRPSVTSVVGAALGASSSSLTAAAGAPVGDKTND